MDEKNINQTEVVSNNETTVAKEKEYEVGRFEFAIFINNNLICKRNFKMFNFIEGSIQSDDFNYTADSIIALIDNDLKSKSRVYTWFYGREYPTEEFTTERPAPWEYTFKLAIYDNERKDENKEVYSKIWDGSGYPAIVRNNVDLTNRVLKFIKRDGEVLIFDAETYFEEYKETLSPEAYVKKAMMGDKEDVLPLITKQIYETCTVHANSPYTKLKDYTTKLTFGKGKDAKTYDLLIDRSNKRWMDSWGESVKTKTDEYFENAYIK